MTSTQSKPMLYPPTIIREITSCAHWADRLTRSDLAQGYIATENDYTSNFTSGFRREINARGIPGLSAVAFVLQPKVERILGADACFIFATPTEFKLGIFEAKWPRLTTQRDGWDTLQKSSGLSHFHEQLSRQRTIAGQAAVWEMFYLEHKFGAQPSYAPDYGSACVWHRTALAYDLKRAAANKWTDSELDALMTPSCISIETVVELLVSCSEGTVISGRDYARPLSDFGVPSQVLLVEYDANLAQPV